VIHTAQASMRSFWRWPAARQLPKEEPGVVRETQGLEFRQAQGHSTARHRLLPASRAARRASREADHRFHNGPVFIQGNQPAELPGQGVSCAHASRTGQESMSWHFQARVAPRCNHESRRSGRL